MRTQTKEIQDNLTPKDAYRILAAGNNRFVKNEKAQRNLKTQVFETRKGQFPFAVVLSCIDSRGAAELVFDQGIGDIFSIRISGNIINKDIIGSMEYGCKVAGSKIVVVMGHTKCGTIAAACNNVELGNITSLLQKIQPAVNKIRAGSEIITGALVEKVAIENVKMSIAQIRRESPLLAEMEEEKEIALVGAIYSLSTGKVNFL